MKTQTLTAFIVEDESKSFQVLNNLLKQHHPDIKIVGTAKNIEDAYNLINKHEPDIVFLDIRLPDGLGFDLLERFERPKFHIIFTTAYDQYAITAIKFGALDYVLKPIDEDELGDAIEKTKEKQRDVEKQEDLVSSQQLQIMLETFNKVPDAKLPSKISISTADGILYRPVKEIIRLEAQANYTKFHFAQEKNILASINIGEYMDQFEPYHDFMRIHRSHLINLQFVDTYVRTDGGYVVMKDKAKVRVSKMYREELLGRLEEL